LPPKQNHEHYDADHQHYCRETSPCHGLPPSESNQISVWISRALEPLLASIQEDGNSLSIGKIGTIDFDAELSGGTGCLLANDWQPKPDESFCGSKIVVR
jgi:hypothetical protein